MVVRWSSAIGCLNGKSIWSLLEAAFHCVQLKQKPPREKKSDPCNPKAKCFSIAYNAQGDEQPGLAKMHDLCHTSSTLLQEALPAQSFSSGPLTSQLQGGHHAETLLYCSVLSNACTQTVGRTGSFGNCHTQRPGDDFLGPLG